MAQDEGKQTAGTGRSVQRAELHKAIWGIADDLRGAVDGWDFKSYVLGFLFYRFASEDIARYINENEPEGSGFSYANLDDETARNGEEQTVQEKGFYILPSQLFENVLAECDDNQDLNETLTKVFEAIESSSVGTPAEQKFKGLFDDLDLNSNKLGGTVAERNERLRKIMHGIASLDLGRVDEADIDAFGDAYEYLMNMYASNAGKSGGEFYTPQEVSNLLARISINGRKDVRKVYDPACGSGSLLLQCARLLGNEHITQGLYGQEINITTYNLCRINMFLHGVNYDKFDIRCGDTLRRPAQLADAPFDVIVSNPPYSIKWVGKDDPTLANDPRFSPAGVLAPKTKADLAFTMHILSSLSSDGTAAIVEFPGAMYRGGAEAKIRKYMVDGNYVSAVIQLPENLFFGTSIATCILVLSKSKTDDKIQFVDASELFAHVGNKNQLMPEHIDRIAGIIRERKDEEHFSKLVGIDEVGKDGSYVLSVGSYVEKRDTRPKVDIDELERQIAETVRRENVLRRKIDAITASIRAGHLPTLEEMEQMGKDAEEAEAKARQQ